MIYGEEIFEIHLGIEITYEVYPLKVKGCSKIIIKMSHEIYATVIWELKKSNSLIT